MKNLLDVLCNAIKDLKAVKIDVEISKFIKILYLKKATVKKLRLKVVLL